jgi:50S ribosomal subunit-associated GTPase HflX
VEILELRDLSDQEISQKVHPENQILEDIEMENH